MKLIKVLIIIVGVIFFTVSSIRLQFENQQLHKQQRVLLSMNKQNYDAADSLKHLSDDLKSQVETYQDWMRQIEQGVARKCPEALKGQSHAPELRVPQSLPKTPNRNLPGIEVRSFEAPDQQYKIDGATPRI